MNRKMKILVCVVLVSVMLFGGMGALKAKKNGISDVNAMIDEGLMDKVPVKVAMVQASNIIDELYTIGQAVPSSTYTVNAKGAGEVDQVYFEIGDAVKAGDVLFRMDMGVFDIEKDKNLIQLSNQLEQSRIAYDQAKKTYEDKKEIFEEGAVSKYDLDASRISFENTELAYENAMKNLNSMQATYSEQDENYIIKSPSDGIVTECTVAEGMFASAQDGFTIIVKDKMEIESSVASKYINDVSVGQKVEIYVNTLDKTYSGEITSISYAPKKGAYPVAIAIDDADALIQSGMYAEISIETQSKEHVKVLPKECIISDGGVDYVYVVDASNVVHQVIVQTGISNSGQLEVQGDLDAGDRVVTEGKEYLDEGKSVVL